jgi:hypothetical protein
MLRKRPDWSRKLPRPLVIPGVTTLKTLADVRELLERHLPAHYREHTAWQHAARCLAEAARGGDPIDVSIALHMAFVMGGGECRPT